MLFLWSEEGCQRLKLLMWSEYMKSLIDNSSPDDMSTWYAILHLGVNVYWGRVHCFASARNYDQKKMMEIIAHDLCSSFIDAHSQRDTSPSEWEHALLAAI